MPIEGGALSEGPAEWGDDGGEVVGLESLAMGGAGGSGDVFVHEGATEVVDAGLEELAYAVDSDLDPGGLDVVDAAAVGEAADGVHQHCFSEGGPAA